MRTARAMSADLPFACRCGAVRYVLHNASAREGERLTCHCRDCQAFARFDREPERLLGDDGGTDLFVARCTNLEITQGKAELASLHLTERPTLRWYARCCDTPLFNSYKNGKLPYLTVVLANCEQSDIDAHLGPVRGHLFVEHAPQPTPNRNFPTIRLAPRFTMRFLFDILSGNRRRSPLFDSETLQPIAVPEGPPSQKAAHVR